VIQVYPEDITDILKRKNIRKVLVENHNNNLLKSFCNNAVSLFPFEKKLFVIPYIIATWSFTNDASENNKIKREENKLYNIAEYGEDSEEYECLKYLFVEGVCICDEQTNTVKINSLSINRPDNEVCFALYNKNVNDNKRLSCKDIENVYINSEVKEEDRKKSLDKLKDYTEWRKKGIGQNKHKESVTAESVWAHVSKASKITDEYDIEKFTEEDWKIICDHYEVKQDAKSTENVVSSLKPEEIKALEHAKKN